MIIDHVLAAHDGVASLDQISAAGISRHRLRSALERGTVCRIRKGWFAAPSAHVDTVRAIRVGGFLTCVSVLRMRGVWCADDDRLHVRVDRHANHLASPDDRATPLAEAPRRSVVLHRSNPADRLRPHSPTDSIESALMHAAACLSRDNAVVVFDSALNLRLTTKAQLLPLAAELTAKHRAAAHLATASAQSGLETKARMSLHRLGIPYRAQVAIEDVGKVDLLIGDRIVLELDGREWHSSEDAYTEDRRRDLILHERGYYVIRLTYAQVMVEWRRIEELIRSLVRRREHLWRARHRHIVGPRPTRRSESVG